MPAANAPNAPTIESYGKDDKGSISDFGDRVTRQMAAHSNQGRVSLSINMR